jgi:F-type H+-transporting ATPase subunit gamma
VESRGRRVVIHGQPEDVRLTRLRDVEHRRESLGEIREIMNSVKSLAYMEIRKLDRLVTAQRAVTEQIGKTAEDFLSFHGEILPRADAATPVQLLVGTERGFCGDLNQKLVAGLKTAAAAGDELILVAVGHKLHSVLEEAMPSATNIICIDGAGVADEVENVLDDVIAALDSLRQKHGAVSLDTTYFAEQAEIARRALLPPFEARRSASPRTMHAPLINVPADELLLELADHYLFASLHEILYTSLLNENQRRVSHLGDAVRHLDERSAELAHRANALRQEEIIEEIEVILLGAQLPATGSLADR